jgi:peroxiredoxin/predicted 2-oxoglutarate/Fe(II)-dependent dioxygenase YbiX
MSKRLWLPGDPVPDFAARSSNSPQFQFSSAAGRYLVLCFFGSAAQPGTAGLLQALTSHPSFDDEHAAFFGISIDPQDEAQGRVQQRVPGIRYFWDFDRLVSQRFGALPPDAMVVDPLEAYQGFTLVLDPLLRVIAHVPHDDVQRCQEAVARVLWSLPAVAEYAGTTMTAPVLILPRVFEPEFCKELVRQYQQHGGSDSGFMREVGGKTVGILDHQFKRRQDFSFDLQPELESLRSAARARIVRRLVPEVAKAFQFGVTRMERYVVACYDGSSGGFFRPHRDNTTPGTAHRRFACTINLNADDYEGGDLRFPEFGPQTYRAPTGGAVVFSCSLLHEATPVTQGERYAFLPFLYDEAAAQIRERNAHSLSGQTINRNVSAQG